MLYLSTILCTSSASLRTSPPINVEKDMARGDMWSASGYILKVGQMGFADRLAMH